MKKNFLTGLAILIPTVITFVIINFIFNVLTTPFQGIVEVFLHNITTKLDGYDLIELVSKLLALVLLATIIFFVGFLGSSLVIYRILSFIDDILVRIPIFSKIYSSAKEIVNTFLAPETKNFSQVVMVPFFNTKSYVIGFLAKDHRLDPSNPNRRDQISVFIPGTPNPTVGYLFFFKPEEVVVLDIKVEEAIKFILSCGKIYPCKIK
jgi:uncharacterized membrane protein